MPEESTTPDLVEMTRRIWTAVNRQDWDTVLSFYAPDACFDMSPVGLGTFEGHVSLRSEWEESFSFFEDLVWEPEQVLSLGHGVVLVALGARGRLAGGTGSIQMGAAWVYEWDEDKIARVTTYNVDEARAAAERLVQERADGLTQQP